MIRNTSKAPQLGQLEALVMECASESDARDIYRKFLEVSKRSKLERHRRRKSDGGSSVVARGVEALFNSSNSKNASNSRSEKTKSVHVNNFEEFAKSQESSNSSNNNNNNNSCSKVIMQDRIVSRQQPWNLVQHTDRNGITHIEVSLQIVSC